MPKPKPEQDVVEPKPQDTPAKPRASEGDNLLAEVYTGTAERTVRESSYHGDSLLAPYNPDDLYRKTNDYSIYEDMLKDDQVSVCVGIKRDLVVGSGWEIVSEEDGQEAIQEDVEQALGEDLAVPFDEMLQELVSSYNFGFSLTEKIFRHRDDGSLSLNVLKTRHPSTWLIHTDKHGNVERYEQHGGERDLTINPKSLIHVVNNRAFQNPYGTSDLRPAYAAWFAKRQVVRFYAIFMEKAASPVPVAKYDSNAPPQAVQDIYDAIRKFQTKTALVIPKQIEVEFLESKSTGEAFERGINIFNMFIGRSLMIPDLLGFQGSETEGGSYSLGKDQIAIFFKHVERRRQSLERVVNREIVWPIVAYNHGLVPKFPKFRLKPISDEHLVELAKLWIEVVKGKTFKPNDEEINHFRKLTRFPEGDVEFPEPLPMPGDEEDEDGEPPKPGEKKPEVEEKKEKSEPKGKQFAFKPTRGDYASKVDFKAIESQMDRFESQVAADAEPVVKRIYDDLFEQMEHRRIVRDQKPERIELLKVKYLKELKLILKRALREAYDDARALGQRELLRGAFRTPLPDDRFLEVLEAETFQYVGDWAYNVTKGARIAMIEAIRDGKPLSAVIDLLDENSRRDSMTSLERFTRTKFTDVMNRGRMSFFQDSGVVAAYQYSAILDDRTTEICAGLHDKIFKAGTEPVPPMHFNCRSILVPITKYEDWDADEKIGGMSADQFIEEHKGDGFPKR